MLIQRKILQILKADIECGWDNGTSRVQLALAAIVVSVVVFFWC